MVEAMEAKVGVNVVKRFDFQSIEFENNSMHVMKPIKKKQVGRDQIDLVVEDILELGLPLRVFIHF